MSTVLAIFIGWVCGISVAAAVIYLMLPKRQPNSRADLAVYREAGRIAYRRMTEHLPKDSNDE